jgi:hypothetical protein
MPPNRKLHRTMRKPVEGPPNPFPKDFPSYTLAMGTALHRIHNVAYVPTAFNPTHVEYRFSPIWDSTNQIVPVLYAGASRPCAFMETIFRHLAGTTLHRQSIREAKLRDRAHSIISTTRDLRLGNLDGAGLARFRVEQQQVTATEAEFYRITARWAESFHRTDASLDGITWISHRATPQRAYLLFGGRVAANDLEVTSPPTSVLNDEPTWEALFHQAELLNVGIPDFGSLTSTARSTLAPATRKSVAGKASRKAKKHR